MKQRISTAKLKKVFKNGSFGTVTIQDAIIDNLGSVHKLTKVTNINFVNCMFNKELMYIDFSNCEFNNCLFNLTDLKSVNFVESRLISCRMLLVNFIDCLFEKVTIKNNHIHKSELKQCGWEFVELIDTDLGGMHIERTYILNSNIFYINTYPSNVILKGRDSIQIGNCEISIKEWKENPAQIIEELTSSKHDIDMYTKYIELTLEQIPNYYPN